VTNAARPSNMRHPLPLSTLQRRVRRRAAPYDTPRDRSGQVTFSRPRRPSIWQSRTGSSRGLMARGVVRRLDDARRRAVLHQPRVRAGRRSGAIIRCPSSQRRSPIRRSHCSSSLGACLHGGSRRPHGLLRRRLCQAPRGAHQVRGWPIQRAADRGISAADGRTSRRLRASGPSGAAGRTASRRTPAGRAG